jgi:hypothetical protein
MSPFLPSTPLSGSTMTRDSLPMKPPKLLPPPAPAPAIAVPVAARAAAAALLPPRPTAAAKAAAPLAAAEGSWADFDGDGTVFLTRRFHPINSIWFICSTFFCTASGADGLPVDSSNPGEASSNRLFADERKSEVIESTVLLLFDLIRSIEVLTSGGGAIDFDLASGGVSDGVLLFALMSDTSDGALEGRSLVVALGGALVCALNSGGALVFSLTSGGPAPLALSGRALLFALTRSGGAPLTLGDRALALSGRELALSG